MAWNYTGAVEYLGDQGYTLSLPDWLWTKPTPEHVPTARERDAVRYLARECDFDGLNEDAPGVMDWMNRA
ncbi:MAG TPA: hypothetical protein VHW66_09395 [Stellaceae bacterium]|nr:hypothetical protein [Stellaceae bacterium]